MLDADLVGGRHHRSRPHGDLAGRQFRPVVQRVDLVRGKALEQAVAHHHAAPAAVLLGRLEDHIGGAVEVARLGQVARGAEQHGRVPVVSAGVHAPFVARAVRTLRGLVHGQAVHVGAQADRAAAASSASLDHADDAGAGQSAMHLDAPVAEPLRDDVGGPVLLEREFGMHVDVAPHGDELVVVAAHAFDGVAHGGSFSGPSRRRCAGADRRRSRAGPRRD